MTGLESDVEAPTTSRSRRSSARRGRRSWWPARRVALVAVVALAAIAVLVFAALIERLVYRAEALPGVHVAGGDVAGTSEARLRAELRTVADRMRHRTVHAQAGPTQLVADASALGVRVDIDATVRAARRDGRSRNPFDALAGVILRRVRADTVAVRTTFDERAVDALLAEWEQRASHGVRNAGLAVEGTTVTVTPPASGTGIAMGAARRLLTAALTDARDTGTLRLPITHVTPAIGQAEAERVAARARTLLTGSYTIRSAGHTFTVAAADLGHALTTTVAGHHLDLRVDARRLGAAIEPQLHGVGDEPVSASFRVAADETVTVVPSRDGRGPDLEIAGRAILRGDRIVDVPLGVAHPTHDTAWARALGIHELVATFTTRHPCCAPRVTNIHVGARYLDGTVLEPGQVFSLNGIIGARTTARGFVVAPVYYEEGFTEDVGGGVSQLATTTFNAAWWGGFEIVEHQPHTIYFDRYPMGREATVNYPYLDLKWRNDSRHGVLVKTSYTATSVTVALYGDREGKTVREVEGDCRVGPVVDTHDDPRCLEVLATVPSTTQVIPCPVKKPADDPTGLCPKLHPGEQRESEPGHTGYSVEFFREITRPGAPPVRQRFSWRYQMLPDVILVGGPPPATTTTTTPGPPKPGVTTTTRPGAPPTTAATPP